MISLRTAFVSLLLAAAAGQAASSAAPQVEVIAAGLDNPRGIAFSPDGRLYVAEAGRGGSGNCITIGDGQQACYGETGAITLIDPLGIRAPERAVTGLPSIAPAGGFGAGGPVDISFLGSGNAQVAMGLGAEASARATLGGKGDLLGRVLQVNAGGGWKAGADIAAFEEAANPVPTTADSNPYGVAALPSRHLVADAGANAIFEVRSNGQIRTLAAFPARMVAAPPFLGLPPGATIPMQAVPTTVVQGPDGWIYVGQLTGFPFPVGGANIYRVPSQGGAPEIAASGFTNIVDMAFDRHGVLYVLQIGNGLAAPGGPPLAAPGKLIRVNADGTQTVIYANLFYPGGLAIGPDGAAYVTNFGIVPGGGQVLRIELD
jgi:hypothetical protein